MEKTQDDSILDDDLYSSDEKITKLDEIGKTNVQRRTVPLIKKEELEIEGELGTGVFGTVAKGMLRDTTVAVKKLKSQKIDNIDQFQAEISIMAHLRHPNIVLFMGASFDPPFIVTEYLDGGDLHDVIEGYEERLKSKVEPPLNDVLNLAIGIARGMSWLHKSLPPIIHKDLKPKNIMLDSNRIPKIIDFGLSEEQKTKELESRKVSGSASWMAPEMLKGENFTEKIDVFAFGIILWQLASGSSVVYDTSKYDNMSPYQAFQTFISDITEKRMRPTIPSFLHQEPEIVNLIQQCWDPDPLVRPSFSSILKSLVRINLTHTLKDDNAIKLWKTKFGLLKVKNIPIKDFYQAIWNFVKKIDPPDEDSSYDLNLKQHCLEAVIDQGSGKSDKMDIEKFGLLLQWYGPLLPTPGNSLSFLERIQSLLKLGFYHGEINSKEAEKTLLSSNDKGKRDFLIRASLNPHYPFTMSRIELGKSSKVSYAHYRIAYNRSNGEYSMMTETKVGLQNIKAESLEKFVKMAQKTILLKKGVLCHTFEYLFVKHVPAPIANPEDNYRVPQMTKPLKKKEEAKSREED